MKVMITGAKGMLGTDLCQVLARDHDLISVDVDDFDVTDAPAVSEFVARHRPEMVIHCAAWTDVDGCERDPERAFQQNATGTWHVASASADVGAAMVYLSTDFVFDGTKGEAYTEFDRPNPINVYGASKLAGEHLVRTLVAHHYIVRTAWLFGKRGRNFVRSILSKAADQQELLVVADQLGSPTYTGDLAAAIAELVVGGRLVPGTYHLVNSGLCSWAELAAEALRLAGKATRVKPMPGSEWPSPARRPACSALRSAWLELRSLPALRKWEEALADYLDEDVS